MRKIEQQMIAAVDDLLGKADFDGVYWKSGNMIVEQNHHGVAHAPGYQRIISVRLHGNEICAIRPAEGTVWVSDCGWQTATTKSRLWALINAFTRRSYRLCQHQHQWLRIMPGGAREPWAGSDTLPLAPQHFAALTPA